MHSEKKVPLINRDISWLSFNERVLQEAEDPNVPLIERFRFLGIFSNNRDEFFRVRVATIRRMTKWGRKAKNLLGANPDELLEKIVNQYPPHPATIIQIVAKASFVNALKIGGGVRTHGRLR